MAEAGAPVHVCGQTVPLCTQCLLLNLTVTGCARVCGTGSAQGPCTAPHLMQHCMRHCCHAGSLITPDGSAAAGRPVHVVWDTGFMATFCRVRDKLWLLLGAPAGCRTTSTCSPTVSSSIDDKAWHPSAAKLHSCLSHLQACVTQHSRSLQGNHPGNNNPSPPVSRPPPATGLRHHTGTGPWWGCRQLT